MRLSKGANLSLDMHFCNNVRALASMVPSMAKPCGTEDSPNGKTMSSFHSLGLCTKKLVLPT
jgi:hypothetical protein